MRTSLRMRGLHSAKSALTSGVLRCRSSASWDVHCSSTVTVPVAASSTQNEISTFPGFAAAIGYVACASVMNVSTSPAGTKTRPARMTAVRAVGSVPAMAAFS